jgi:hypothetical protein
MILKTSQAEISYRLSETRLHRLIVVDEVALENLSKITVISVILSH